MYTGTEQGPLAAHNVTLYQLYTFSPNRRRRRRPACVPRRPSQARPPTRRPTRRPGRMPAGGGGVRKGNTTALYEFSLYNASDYNDPTRRSGRRPPRGLGKVSGRPTRRQVGPEDASWPTHSGENAAIKGWSWPNFWANLVSFSLCPSSRPRWRRRSTAARKRGGRARWGGGRRAVVGKCCLAWRS